MRPDLLEAVCFDIGGTLVAMERGTLAEEIAEQLGTDRELVGDLLVEHGKRSPTTPAELATAVARGCGCPDGTDAVAEILRRRHLDVSQPRLYDDVADALRALAQGGWRILYLSNAVGYADHGPEPSYYCHAEVVLHSWEIGVCTPDPAAFRAVADRARLEPNAIVHVGDSWDTDVAGALAAGWQAVHLWRHRQEPTSLSHADVPRIATLAELTAILPQHPRRHRATAVNPGGRG